MNIKSRLLLFMMVLPGSMVVAETSTPVWQAPDLLPVTVQSAPTHPPVELVRDGKPLAIIVVRAQPVRHRAPQRDAGSVMNALIRELQDAIQQSTGARLTVQRASDFIIPSNTTAIVIGNCREALDTGLDGSTMPPEGFAIKTAPGRIFIVGNDAELAPAGSGVVSKGTAWGIAEFLERFVGVRWYWPRQQGGRSVVKQSSLTVPAVYLSDAPVFNYRMIWPDVQFPMTGKGNALVNQHVCLRSDVVTPHLIQHHNTTDWLLNRKGIVVPDNAIEAWGDGSRPDRRMLEWSTPLLNLHIGELSRHYDKGEPLRLPAVGDTITVSPWDFDIGRYGTHAALWSDDGTGFASALWGKDGGRFGAASRIPATFVAQLAELVHKRWPTVTIGYFATMNYTLAPATIVFPGNVQVMADNLHGMAMLREPSVWAQEQANIQKWQAISQRPIQTWFHIYRPLVQTDAPYEFPHLIQRYYKENRARITGSYVTGHDDYWARQHVSLYIWFKCLWNPDIDVEAVLSEYCRRMYGPAAKPMRELLDTIIDAWEKTPWPVPRTCPSTVYGYSYTPAVIERMGNLVASARKCAAGNPESLAAIDYFTARFAAMHAEVDTWRNTSTLVPLEVPFAAAMPFIDGRLDEICWTNQKPLSLVLKDQTDIQRRAPAYATRVRSIWTRDGVAFAFDMDHPASTNLAAKTPQVSRDMYTMWRENDTAEILLDVTGRNDGEYHQIVINPLKAISDAWMDDETWNLHGEQVGVQRNPHGWSLEIFMPFSAFRNAQIPGNGKEVVWTGQLARHRVGDPGDPGGKTDEDARLNFRHQTCHQGHYHHESDQRDLIDFTRIIFRP